ncbi:unnamed protein product [Urochloa humidicola]
MSSAAGFATPSATGSTSNTFCHLATKCQPRSNGFRSEAGAKEATIDGRSAKVSRGKVKYPHKTGSRCYIAQTYAVVRLEAIVAEPTEGKDPKTATEVVLGIIKVVQNVCLETAAPKKSDTSTVRARVQGLEAEVQAEREDSAAQRRQIEYQQNQFESLKSKFEEFGAHNQKQQEMGSLEKQGETESI